MKVLVIEDEPIILQLTKRYLTNFCGCEVTTAEDGVKGLALFNQSPHQFDLIVTDINLPKLDGLSLLERIKEFNSIPIICITGHSDLEEQAKSSDLNIVSVLMKPFELTEFGRIIADVKNKANL
ncbi:MAG: response regulator [Desulfobacterales bacterium]|nr:response regulator [Desulfobacterales bacterium]